MEFLEAIKQLNLWKPVAGMTVLDVGCRNGWLWKQLQETGCSYDGIDTVDMLDDKAGIHFQQISFIDFAPDKSYDLIFARNVFFFAPDQIGHAKRYLQYLKPGGIMCVSFMIDDDPHVGKVVLDGTTFYGVSRDVVIEMMQEVTVVWSEEFSGQKSDLGGNMKDWHLYQMIVRKK